MPPHPAISGETSAASSTASSPAAAQPPWATPPACPVDYLPPAPDRPVLRLALDVASDHRTVTGTETVTFTPETAIDELDFRLWPNGPEGGRTQGRLEVTSVRAPGTGRPHSVAAGARRGVPGTLLVVPLTQRSPAIKPVTAVLSYTLRLPPARLDRLGATSTLAWWGSAHPMLAWVRGRGWVREEAQASYGETQASEAAALDLTVTAPAADVVLATGLGSPPGAVAAGRRRWHFVAAAARDVAVAVGRFRTLTRLTPAGGGARTVPVTVAALPGATRSLSALMAQLQRALAAHAARLGSFPAEALTAVDLPATGHSGVEYPGLEFIGDVEDAGFTITHETAHQWFYNLVGDDQARDPWLDEAFATAEQALVDEQGSLYRAYLMAPGRAGASLASFGGDTGRYFETVYYKGTAAVLAARTAAGPGAFDAAIRCYLRAQAWRVAAPADLARALANLPAALAVLQHAGALPGPLLAGPAPAPGSGGS